MFFLLVLQTPGAAKNITCFFCFKPIATPTKDWFISGLTVYMTLVSRFPTLSGLMLTLGCLHVLDTDKSHRAPSSAATFSLAKIKI